MKSLTRTALAGVLFGLPLVASAAPVDLLIKYAPGSSPRLVNALLGARVIQEFPQIGWAKVRLNAPSPERAISRAKGLRGVLTANPDRIIAQLTQVEPNDPFYTRVDSNTGQVYQYGPQAINSAAAWALSLGSRDVTIAVVDSGVLLNHEDLRTQVRSDGYDWSDGDSDPNPSPDNFPGGASHGTHVAGIAGAATNNGIGVASTAWNVRILPEKVFPNAYETVLVNAMMDSVAKGAQVINLSLGGAGASQVFKDAVAYARENDVVVVAAAGNYNSNNDSQPFYPSNYPGVVSVAATNRAGGFADFSNYGATTVNVAAPGDMIWSTISVDSSLNIVDQYTYNSGTSMASPMVASAVALMRAYSPLSTAVEIEQALYDSTRRLSDPVKAVKYGLIDVNAALNLLGSVVVSELQPDDAAVFVSNGADEGNMVNAQGDPSLDAAKLSANDGYTFDVNSIYRRSQGSLASFEATMNLPQGLGTVTSATLSMNVKAATRVTALIFVRNPATGLYESLKNVALTPASQELTFKLSPAQYNKYGADGTMQLLIRTILPVRLGGSGIGYRLSLDSLGLRVLSRAL